MKNVFALNSQKINEITTVILDTDGATCTSCAHTLEKVGPKFKGINDVRVDRVKKEIHIDCDGKRDTVDQMVELVRRIGYTATIRSGVKD